MFTSVAHSCARNGIKLSVRGIGVSLCVSANISPRTVNLMRIQRLSLHSSSRLLSPTLRKLSNVSTARAVSLSTDPLGSVSDPAETSECFGPLSTDFSSRRRFKKTSPTILDVEHHEEEEVEVKRPARTNTTYWYFLQCKKLIKENKLQEALDLFSNDMLRGERLEPKEYNYDVLIGACGRAGELKKAFGLYNDMKKRGLEATDLTYTALFNACAESQSKQTGLRYALKLEQELRRKNYALSTITYHALLKAHAITNHLQACLHTLREMLQNGHIVTQETFHYLLMGCWKDKETGFRLALQVWRQMLKSGIVPDSKNYNLLLGTCRDCGIGNPALATAVLLSPDSDKRKGVADVKGSKCIDVIDIDVLESQLLIQPDPHRRPQQDHRDAGDESSRRQDSVHLIPVKQMQAILQPVAVAADSTAPNLLDVFEGKRAGVVSLCAVDRTSDRLALIGGAQGFLEKMEAQSLRPDLKTLTLLANTMEPGVSSLEMLLKVAKQHQVKLDVEFFNSLIRRAARAGDMKTGKAVLSVMRQRYVSVDVKTFGSLALGCERQQDGLQLLKDMEEAGFRPNVHVFSALIGQASRRLDYVYLRTILKMMTHLEVWPNEVIIKQLEFAARYPPNYNQHKTRNNYLIHIDGFRGFYQQWLETMPALEGDQTALQAQPQAEVLKTEAADGLTETQRNQSAAARRYHSRKKSKLSSPVFPL